MEDPGRIETRRRQQLASIALSGLVVATTLIGGAPPASAAGGFRYIIKERRIPPGGTKTITAKCPSTKHVIGGGGSSVESATFDLYMTSSFPYDGSDNNSRPDDGWKVKFTTFDSYEEPVVYAICSSINPHYSVLDYQVDGFTDIQRPIACGGDRSVISGGYRGAVEVRPIASFPYNGGATGDLWRLSLYNASGGPRSVTGFAICADLDVAYKSAFAVENPSSTQAHWYGDAACDSARPNPIGGGFYSGGAEGGGQESRLHVQVSAPILHSLGNYWRVTVDNSLSNQDPGVEVWATCAPNL